MTGETRQVTVRASRWKVSQWEDAAIHIKGRDVRRFMILAADWLTRRLREVNYLRSVPDPVGQRMDEKRYMGQLLKAARAAVEYVPKQVDDYLRGPLYPKRDLQHAIENVKSFLERTGEDYSCED